jgi:hypothetical protein
MSASLPQWYKSSSAERDGHADIFAASVASMPRFHLVWIIPWITRAQGRSRIARRADRAEYACTSKKAGDFSVLTLLSWRFFPERNVQTCDVVTFR